MTGPGARTDDAATRWAGRWLAPLEEAGAGLARHRQRGAALVRRGRVADLTVEPGTVRGRVHEDRVSPYDVSVTVPVPDDASWDAAANRLAGELRHTAALLDGRLPEDLDEALDGTGVRVLPERDEATERCTCTAREQPCVHVVALHHAVADLIERDPFVLLTLRGRPRARLLDELRARRSGGRAPLSAADLGLRDEADLFTMRGDLDDIVLHPAPVEDPAMLFHHLGPPPGVEDTAELERLIERAAATAWRLASGEGADVADDEVLLAELRAQRTATAGSVAGALGRDVDRVREALDRLFETGVVLRTGQDDTARYRAASS